MWTIIICVALVALGIYIEKRYSPRLKDGNLEYNASKGVRNKKKLF